MTYELLATPWGILAVGVAGLLALGFGALILWTSVYKHVICWRYLFGGWKAVVPLISALPAALGVFLLILVFAIMDGFAHETREMTRGTLADVIVDSHMEGLPYYDDFIRQVERIKGVETATPIIQTYAVARVKPHREMYPGVGLMVKPIVRPCQIIGIRAAEKVEMGRFKDYLLRQHSDRYPTDRLLDLPPEFRKTDPPHATCIAGIGLIGIPRAEEVFKPVKQGAGMQVLAFTVAGICLIALLFIWRVARRRLEGRSLSLGRGIVWGLTLWLVLLAAGAAADLLLTRFAAGGWGRTLVTYVFIAPAALAAIVALACTLAGPVYGIARWGTLKQKERPGWLVATAAGGLVVLVLGGAGMFWPVAEVEVQSKDVVDFPLLDYGDDLVVSTIPVTPKGAFETEIGGVPKVSSRALALVDTFKSKFWEADSTQVYVDFKVAQQMAGMEAQPATDDRPAVPARCSQVQIKIADPTQGRLIRDRIREAWRTFASEHRDIGILNLAFNTWEDQQKMILTVVEVEKNITALMLGLMFLGFGVLTALISYVMAYIKSRDVGILKALGARDAGVGSLFLGYGFIIGLIGTAIGLVAALLMLHYLDAIEIWVNQTLHIDVFPREMYYFESIPQHLSPLWCVCVCLGVLALSTLASTAGGLLAALKQPVETLRYE